MLIVPVRAVFDTIHSHNLDCCGLRHRRENVGYHVWTGSHSTPIGCLMYLRRRTAGTYFDQISGRANSVTKSRGRLMAPRAFMLSRSTKFDVFADWNLPIM